MLVERATPAIVVLLILIIGFKLVVHLNVTPSSLESNCMVTDDDTVDDVFM